MHNLRLTLAAATLFILSASIAYAQDAVIATCKDGTSWSGARRSGACRGHQGVQAFGTPAAAGATPAAQIIGAQSAPPAAVAPAPRLAPAAATPAVGGGAGQVWVNTKSKVYHCQGDRYYGKTKAGEYMTEGAAKSAGDRPDHGKACS